MSVSPSVSTAGPSTAVPDEDVVLGANCHGKGRVRLVKVIRERDGMQSVAALTVEALVEGPDMSSAFLEGDNSRVVPTDTIKNTVYVLAKEHAFDSPEAFGIIMARHLCAQYPAFVSHARVSITCDTWSRIHTVDSAGRADVPHGHAFRRAGTSKRHAWVVADAAGGLDVRGGLTGVDLLKTTQSAFRGFPRDRYTSLVEVDDRLVGTSASVEWRYSQTAVRAAVAAMHGSGGSSAAPAEGRAPSFARVADSVERTIVDTFAGPADHGVLSLSVQATQYDCGRAVLRAVPVIESVSLTMPNLHHLPFPLAPYGLVNKDFTGYPDIFFPIDEPHGIIKATVHRRNGAGGIGSRL